MAKLWHEKLKAYQRCLSFISRTEALIADATEAASVLDHLDRASESIAENIVNGNSQWSPDTKCRYFDIARGSAHECAACMDVCHAKGLISRTRRDEEKEGLRQIVNMLVGLIRSQQWEVRGPAAEYVAADKQQPARIYFDHERLEVYQSGLGLVGWVNADGREAEMGVRRWRKVDALATSIVLNIAEGNGRSQTSDHRSFLDIAHRSALKAALQLDLAGVKTSRPLTDLDEGKVILGSIVRMLLGMRGYFEEGD